MSLIDPLESARRKEEGYRGSFSALVRTLIFGLLGLAFTGIIGFGIGGFVDQMRIMTLNSVFSTWDAGAPEWVRAAALPVGIVGSLIALGGYGRWNHRYTGTTSRFAGIGPASIVLIGLAVGAWLATTMWAQPDAIGIAVDPTFGEDEAWGVGAWIVYAAQWWLPGGFAVLALLSLIGRLASRGGAKRRRGRVEDLLRPGAVTSAEVTASPTVSLESSRVAASLTLRFEDLSGVSRWVTSAVFLPPREIPVVGARVPLVYATLNPSDVTNIFVSISGGSAPEDFTAVTAAR